MSDDEPRAPGARPWEQHGQVLQPCTYESHRKHDWVTEASQVSCGMCHPPTTLATVVRRGEPDFDRLAWAAMERCALRCTGPCDRPLSPAVLNDRQMCRTCDPTNPTNANVIVLHAHGALTNA